MSNMLRHCKEGSFSSRYKQDGELLVRGMNEAARAFYNNGEVDVYHDLETDETIIKYEGEWFDYETAKQAEEMLAGQATWYAVLKDEEDTDHGTGSFDRDKAFQMARDRDCKFVGAFTNDDYCIEIEEV